MGRSWGLLNSSLSQTLLLLAAFLLTVFAQPAWADDPEDRLKSDYEGKIVTLRHFYEGRKLKFGPDGALQGRARVGPWTVDGRILVTAVRLHNGRLNITGRRLYLSYDSQSSQFRDSLPALARQHSGISEKLRDFLQGQNVDIEIQLPSEDLKSPETTATMKAIFLAHGESMSTIVPPEWRAYFEKQEGKPRTTPDPMNAIYRVGGGVSPPRETFSPEPEYSDAARELKYEGVTVLYVVVDPSGKPKDVQITNPCGLGLDEKAVAAVSTWKFEPAKKDGQPVAVAVNVQVNFHLY